MNRLEGLVILVTGAGRGIGAACAARYASEGARVLVADIDVASAEATAVRIGARAIGCDHTQAAQCQAAVAAAVQHFGGLDALHNNAGIGFTAAFDATAEADARRVFEVLLLGPILMTQAALPQLRTSRDARRSILFTASGLGLHGRPGVSVYSAAKHGVLGLMRSLALELGPEGIRSNAVCPGVVDTEMVRSTTGAWGRPDEVLEKFRLTTPLRCNATPEDIAASAAFLLSGDAGNCTGTALVVDGGAHEA